ncbi:MAG: hypothetical protein KAH23_04940 [Kiritimatiellae bacterium]|nr:hypothetical protein [Kiritimatiellia bacterium]
MHRFLNMIILLFVLAVIFPVGTDAAENSTINTKNKWAWSVGASWINCRPSTTNGAVIGQFTCSGYFYSSTAGWINLGDGTPTNGIYYSNANSGDYGVNHDSQGHLTGYAWCESSGWINFEWTNKEHANAPKVDVITGNFSGNAWGDSLGWISLTNLSTYAQTDTIKPGTDSNTNNIPDDWELNEIGNLTKLAGGGGTNDADKDGVSDYKEYLAGTCPTNIKDYLHLTGMTITNGTNVHLVWASEKTRLYDIDKRTNLLNGSWTNYQRVSVTGSSSTITIPAGSDPRVFYKIKAVLPLSD